MFPAAADECIFYFGEVIEVIQIVMLGEVGEIVKILVSESPEREQNKHPSVLIYPRYGRAAREISDIFGH